MGAVSGVCPNAGRAEALACLAEPVLADDHHLEQMGEAWLASG